MLGRELLEATARVRKHFLSENLARGIEDAHVMPAVPEIDANGNVVRAHKA